MYNSGQIHKTRCCPSMAVCILFLHLLLLLKEMEAVPTPVRPVIVFDSCATLQPSSWLLRQPGQTKFYCLIMHSSEAQEPDLCSQGRRLHLSKLQLLHLLQLNRSIWVGGSLGGGLPCRLGIFHLQCPVPKHLTVQPHGCIGFLQQHKTVRICIQAWP